MTNFRHWAGVLRRQAKYLREKAEAMWQSWDATPAAVETIERQADLFEQAADAIEEALRLEREVRLALAHWRDLDGREPVCTGGASS